jgi:hypothetical protein
VGVEQHRRKKAVSSLTALTTLVLSYCPNVTAEGLREVSGLTKLKTLHLAGCNGVTTEGLRAVIK